MARLQGYRFYRRRLVYFSLVLVIFTCAEGIPTGRDISKVRSTTSDPGLYDVASDDAGLQWNSLEGFDLDGNPWLGLSSPPSDSWKNSKPPALSHADDDYDYDDYDGDNIIDDDDAGEKGSQFLSIPRRDFHLNEGSKSDDDDGDDVDDNGSDEGSKLKHGVRSLSGDINSDGGQGAAKTATALDPVQVMQEEDEKEEDDLILESDDGDQVGMDKKKISDQSDDEGDEDEQVFGEPEMERMDTVYDDHAFLF